MRTYFQEIRKHIWQKFSSSFLAIKVQLLELAKIAMLNNESIPTQDGNIAAYLIEARSIGGQTISTINYSGG